MKWENLPLALVVFVLLAAAALAMSSANYRLDWFTPLTGGGGGPAGSAQYAGNFTVGQSAIGVASSTNYGGCLGYWCGTTGIGVGQHRVYLPVVLRDF